MPFYISSYVRISKFSRNREGNPSHRLCGSFPFSSGRP